MKSPNCVTWREKSKHLLALFGSHTREHPFAFSSELVTNGIEREVRERVCQLWNEVRQQKRRAERKCRLTCVREHTCKRWTWPPNKPRLPASDWREALESIWNCHWCRSLFKSAERQLTSRSRRPWSARTIIFITRTKKNNLFSTFCAKKSFYY